MKYIRTKDGRIIELPKTPTLMKYDNTIIDLNAVRQGKVGHEIINALIDKQADTIEELCDEAVFFDKDNKPHYKSQEGNVWYLGAGLFTETLRFGIFTDKGLIFVAKVNDKGELELI